jgi:cell division protein FtsN
MNKKSSSKIITTGFMMLLIATGAALVAVLILSIGATVAEEAEAKEFRREQQEPKQHTPPQMPVLEGGPANGTILYYTVITANVVPLTAPPADVLEQAQNATAERREGAEEGEEAAE